MLLLMLLLMFPSPAAAGDAALAGLFARKGVEGTMVLSSLKTQVGWYVGYIETEDEVWFFALNMDVLGEADLCPFASNCCARPCRRKASSGKDSCVTQGFV